MKRACLKCIKDRCYTPQAITGHLVASEKDCLYCPKIGAVKKDDGKLAWHLLPEDALVEVLKVFQMGSKKYGDFNWLHEPAFDYTRLHNSAQRHRSNWMLGADLDSESGLPELAHVCANYLMLLTYHLRKVGNDDRQKIIKKDEVLLDTKPNCD